MRISAGGRVMAATVVLVVTAAACGGSRGRTASAPTGGSAATTPTTAAHVASLADVFGAPLPAGYSLTDAPAALRASIRQELQIPGATAVLRDADLRVIQRTGRIIGSVTVFLLQPGQASQQSEIIRGYAESRPGSSRSAATIGGKAVTLIKWSSAGDVAYAASTSAVTTIIDARSKAELDVVTPALNASI